MEVEPITVDQDEAEELKLALKNLEERRKQKRQKRIVTIVIVCAVIAALIIGFFVVRALTAPKQEDVSAALVDIPSAASAGTSVQASGTLKPGTSAVATAEVSGVITSVLVKEGQHVNAGDVLFTLRSSSAEKALSDAQTGVDRAQRNFDRAQSDVAQAQQDYDSAVDTFNAAVDAYNNSLGPAASAGQAAYDVAYNKAIAAIPSTATEAERKRLTEEAKAEAQLAYDEAYLSALAPDPGSFDHSLYTAAIDSANSSVASANESLEDARKTYTQAQEDMDKCQVRAPRSGTVLTLNAVVGSEVGSSYGGSSSSSSDGTATIGDLSSFEVDVEVNEIDVSAVKVGQTAEVTFSAFPDLQEEAEVVSVAAASTSSAGSSVGAGSGGAGSGGIVTFTVKLVIKQPDPRLKAGMSANVKILTDGADAAAKGPASASGASADAAGASGSASATSASGASSASSAA